MAHRLSSPRMEGDFFAGSRDPSYTRPPFFGTSSSSSSSSSEEEEVMTFDGHLKYVCKFFSPRSYRDGIYPVPSEVKNFSGEHDDSPLGTPVEIVVGEKQQAYIRLTEELDKAGKPLEFNICCEASDHLFQSKDVPTSRLSKPSETDIDFRIDTRDQCVGSAHQYCARACIGIDDDEQHTKMLEYFSFYEAPHEKMEPDGRTYLYIQPEHDDRGQERSSEKPLVVWPGHPLHHTSYPPVRIDSLEELDRVRDKVFKDYDEACAKGL